jgi:hypothetical protein
MMTKIEGDTSAGTGRLQHRSVARPTLSLTAIPLLSALQRGALPMPITPPTRVIASHLRWPLKLHRHTVYQLATEAGDFASARPPIVYDKAGQPTALTADLARGSLVRVEHQDGVLRSVQMLQPVFANPFGDC